MGINIKNVGGRVEIAGNKISGQTTLKNVGCTCGEEFTSLKDWEDHLDICVVKNSVASPNFVKNDDKELK